MPHQTVTKDSLSTIRTELKRLFPKDVYETWFAPLTFCNGENGNLIAQTPNEFSAIWLEDNYLDILTQKISDILEREVALKIEVPVENIPHGGEISGSDSSAVQANGEAALAAPAIVKSRRVKTTHERTHTVQRGGVPAEASDDSRWDYDRQDDEDLASGRLPLRVNPRNTFENFIVGPSNQLAHAASLAVAKSPSTAYNPLFLYGDTGLGKTHLMHAIGTHISTHKQKAKIVYVSCEKFTNHFMRAIQENTLGIFRRQYRRVDILLIDDIHFLAGKERTQEEFFHTFNELFESGRQICISSDRPASEISRLESRLVSRFQWGMVADIQAPDLETRTAILSKKAKALQYEVPQDILQFLAQRITRNVRRMEGALLKVGTYAKLTKKRLDVPACESLIHDILQEEAQNQVTLEKIQKQVAEYYDLRMSDMLSKRRPSHIAFPRQVAMYLSRLLTNHPLKEIGEAFGGRDHGTVIHAVKTVENMMEQNETVKRNVEYLTKMISH